MGKHSTAATRAARRSFYTSQPLWSMGQILDRLKAIQRQTMAGLLCLVFVLLGSVSDFTTPLDTPCETEDSTWCFWNSAHHGNGQGQSFIAITEEWRIYVAK